MTNETATSTLRMVGVVVSPVHNVTIDSALVDAQKMAGDADRLTEIYLNFNGITLHVTKHSNLEVLRKSYRRLYNTVYTH